MILMAPKTVTSVKLLKRYLTSFMDDPSSCVSEILTSVTWQGSGYKVECFEADTLLEGRSEGRITHEAIKADRNREGSKD